MPRLLLVGVLALSAHALYDALQSEVAVISQTNWMAQVVKGRQNDNIILVHFLNGEDAQSQTFAKEFTAKAAEYKGVYLMGYVDCRKDAPLCRKEGVASFPTLRIYPPLPLPHETLALDVKAALSRASKFLKSYLTEVDDDNVTGFLNTDMTLPKVLYFADKPGAPLLLRALSRNFHKKLSFGIVRSSATGVLRSHNVKKLPTMLVFKSGHKRPFQFEKEFKYREAFEFLNFFSEQFVPTMDEKASEAKPWLFESVPELTEKSANEVCLALEKTLCVILFAPRKPEKAELETLKSLKAEFENKIDRAASYKFMWINSSTNAKWNADFNVQDPAALSVRVLNPGRRKRFTALDAPFSYEAVEGLLEKISGGDARFTPLSGELPGLSAEL